MWTLKFWKQAAERSIKTGAQSGLVVLSGDLVNAWQLDYGDMSGIVLGGMLLSVLTSLASMRVGDSDSASLVQTGRTRINH